MKDEGDTLKAEESPRIQFRFSLFRLFLHPSAFILHPFVFKIVIKVYLAVFTCSNAVLAPKI